MGPPGSGKGTQGQRLAAHFQVPHIAVGDLLRAEVDAQTELGAQVAETMARGDLISDDVITELITPHVRSAADSGGFILDGYPRTLNQAVTARQSANAANVDADVVLWLDVNPAELVHRMMARGDAQDRVDDTPETISRRLQVYEDATRPLLDYYRGRGLLVTVDASQPPAAVTESALHSIKAHLGAA
jgi:adenylate kinase